MKGSFCGYIDLSGVDATAHWGNAPPSGKGAIWTTVRLAGGAAGLYARGVDLAERPGKAAAIKGRIRWRDSLLKRTAAELGDAAALVNAYERFGEDLAQQAQGHFSCALIDSDARRAYLAIDRIGVCSLYYASTPTALLFASDAGLLKAHPDVHASLSDQALFNYVYFHMVPSPQSTYRDILKIGPAGCLVYSNDSLESREYWRPHFSEEHHSSEAQLSRNLRPILNDSVRDACDGAQSPGCFLSGGIDSSTVTGIFAGLGAARPRTYSIGFKARGYDETHYARLAARQFGTEHHEYYVTPQDVVDLVPRMAGAYQEPFGNASAIPAYYCAKLAHEDGIDVMLAGDGGDELFAGNDRYAKQLVFEAYARIPLAVRNRLIEPSLENLPWLTRLPLLQKVHSYVTQAKIPLPDRLETYNFLHRHPAPELFSPDFLDAIDPGQPLSLFRERYHMPAQASSLNRMLFLDWKFTLADNDIRKVSTMCQLAGVDVAYPMLDDRLLDFSTTVPSALKLRRGQLRYFFKRSVRDLLPAEIIAKKKHGFGLPFGIWLRDERNLQELAYDSIGKLKSRRYFRPSFLDRAIDLHHHGHAAYYGGLIWILMILELWLQHHIDVTRPADAN